MFKILMAVSALGLGLLAAVLIVFSFVVYLFTGRMKGFRDIIIIFDIVVLSLVAGIGFLNLDDTTSSMIYLGLPIGGLLFLSIRFNRYFKGPYHELLAMNNRIIENKDLSVKTSVDLSLESELHQIKSQQNKIIEQISDIVSKIRERDISLKKTLDSMANHTQSMDEEVIEITNDVDHILQSAAIISEKVNETLETSTLFLDKIESDFRYLTEIVYSADRLSDQTNLIAVNAAIEASHSKTQSNFETVADAIQGLSRRMRNNTDRLRTSVLDIKRDIINDIDKMNNELNTLENKINDIGEASNRSSQYIHQQVAYIHELSSLIKKTSEFNRSMDELLDKYKFE